jgi:predicted O-methyltransferase YrrM
MARASGERPVSLDLVATFRMLAVGEDALLPHLTSTPAERALVEPLASHLRGRELGNWSLGPLSLTYLRNLVLQHRPSRLLEFGSGISTLVLAHAMTEARGGGEEGPLVISVEQENVHASSTRDLLSDAGLDHLAMVVVAPLSRQQIEGIWTTCYALPESLSVIFRDRRADLVVIDGPAAEAGARFGTLPLARPFVGANASFVLDDALRDGELRIARRWRSLPYIEIEGIRLIEKGLLTGIIHGE